MLLQIQEHWGELPKTCSYLWGPFRCVVQRQGKGGTCCVAGLSHSVSVPHMSGVLVSCNLRFLETISWCIGPVCVHVIQLPGD